MASTSMTKGTHVPYRPQKYINSGHNVLFRPRIKPADERRYNVPVDEPKVDTTTNDADSTSDADSTNSEPASPAAACLDDASPGSLDEAFYKLLVKMEQDEVYESTKRKRNTASTTASTSTSTTSTSTTTSTKRRVGAQSKPKPATQSKKRPSALARIRKMPPSNSYTNAHRFTIPVPNLDDCEMDKFVIRRLNTRPPGPLSSNSAGSVMGKRA